VTRALWLADALRAEGVTVVEEPGWRDRGNPTFSPKGVICHHTAGPARGDAPSLGTCINGRPGLPGPLCQIVLARSGTAHVIASGRANHAGAGGWRGLTGNTSVFGIEAENTGLGEPWPVPMTTAAPPDGRRKTAIICFQSKLVPVSMVVSLPTSTLYWKVSRDDVARSVNPATEGRSCCAPVTMTQRSPAIAEPGTSTVAATPPLALAATAEPR